MKWSEGFDAEQSALWHSLIEQRLGMVLPSRQQGLFEQCIKSSWQQSGLSLEQYLALLVRDAKAWQQLAERLLIHETQFFRHPPSFAVVAQHCRERQQLLRVWSAGCATGEETWSLAITAAEQGCPVQVFGTDYSDAALSEARAGCYAVRRVSRLSEAQRERFGSYDAARRHWRVGQSLRAQVVFGRQNLHSLSDYALRDMDIVFCQNVLIYFRRFERRDIVQKMIEHLRPGGLLVLGPGELSGWQPVGVRRHPDLQTLAYLKL